MANTARASINPRIHNPPSIYSSYRLNASFKSGDSPAVAHILTINADVAVATFKSDKLVLKYNKVSEDGTGFVEIDGYIGAGKIQFNTSNKEGKGVAISGDIEGGPPSTQSFVATGTWTIA
jgi:hypothetical protein